MNQPQTMHQKQHIINKDRKRLERKQSIAFIFSFIKSSKKFFFFIFIISLIISAISLGNVFLMQKLTEVIAQRAYAVSNFNQSEVSLYAGLLLMLYLINFGIGYFLGIVIAYIIEWGSKRLTIYLFAKMLRTEVVYFDRIKIGEILSRLNNDLANAVSNLPTTLNQIAYSIFVMIAMFLGMFLISAYMSLIALALIPLGFIGVFVIVKKSQKIYASRQKALGNLNAFLEETISGQKEINLYNQEKNFQKIFKKLNDIYVRHSYQADFYFSFMIPWNNFSSNLSVIVIISIGAVFAINKIPFAGIYDANLAAINQQTFANTEIQNLAYMGQYMVIINAFLMMLRNFNGPLFQMVNVMNSIQSFFSSAKRLVDLSIQKEEFLPGEITNMQIVTHDQPKKVVKQLTNTPLSDWLQRYDALLKQKKPFLTPFYYPYLQKDMVHTNIEVKNLSFAYEPNKPVLKNISFKVQQGQIVAIVGPTGSGKSTFINLLTKFYDISEGDILFDGVSIKQITKESMRKNISIVLQDNIIFNDTIRNNIKYGNLHASDEEIIAAAKKAEAHNFIMQLKNGYDTMMKGNGETLSHGQKQLIGISRAILSPSELLILDEATSSVDTTTEKEIQQAMLNLVKNKTSFEIAHRLSTIKNADLILVLKDGQIIEQGNHQALLASDAFYAQMYRAQIGQS